MIKNSKKYIADLDLKIKEELGIDIHKYRNEEVVESLIDLLALPKYAVNWGIRPILIAVILFIVGFFVLDLVHIEYLFYVSIGTVLFLLNGVLMGLLFLVWKMKRDTWSIVAYSLEVMESAVLDLRQVSGQFTSGNGKQALPLLFKGVIHILTIPMVSNVITKKVPYFGKFLNIIISRTLRRLAAKIQFDEKDIEQEIVEKKEGKILSIYLKSISSTSRGLRKVFNFTFGLAQLPLAMIWSIALLGLVLFLYSIH